MKKILILVIVLIVIATVTGIFLFNQADDLPDTSRDDGVSETPPELLEGLNLYSMEKDDSGMTQSGLAETVNGNNKFAFEIYNKYSDGDENVLISPYSISTAFSILHEGAREQTANEIKDVFHFPDDEVKRSSFARLHNSFNDGSAEYELSTANALWAQKDYPFLEEYFSTVKKYYGSGIANVDFKSNPEGAREIINTWVEEQTNDKIKDLFAKDTITTDTRLVITNTVYFKGEWENKFDEDETTERDFYIGSDNKIKTPMMHFYDEEIRFNYAETDDLQVLEMPYKGEKLSMLIFLPKDSDLEGLESNFDEGKLNELKSSFRNSDVDILIPKFKF